MNWLFDFDWKGNASLGSVWIKKQEQGKLVGTLALIEADGGLDRVSLTADTMRWG